MAIDKRNYAPAIVVNSRPVLGEHFIATRREWNDPEITGVNAGGWHLNETKQPAWRTNIAIQMMRLKL